MDSAICFDEDGLFLNSLIENKLLAFMGIKL